MKPRELENALLLRESGELSETDLKELTIALEQNPELAKQAEENQVLQQAGPYSSSILVPEIPELTRARILTIAEKPTNKNLSRLLAIAALLVLGFGLFPHLSNSLQPEHPVVAFDVTPIRHSLTAEDPILDTLRELESELSLWSSYDMNDSSFLEDETDWATTLISSEESI